MADAYTFKFDNLTRIGEDPCGITERDLLNNKHCSYHTTNFYSHLCGDRKLIDLVTSQPNINFRDGVGDCNIGDETKIMRTGDVRNAGRIMLNQRTFSTIPYLGKGEFKPDIDSILRMGSVSSLKKEARVLMEKSWGNEKVDLLPSLQKTIQNPSNLVEGEALDGWIRGGLPSRDLSRTD